MAGRRVYNISSGGSDNNTNNSTNNNNNISALLHSSTVPCPALPDQPLDSFFLSSSSSPSFFGSRSMVSFEDVRGGNKSFFRSFDHDEVGDEEYDEYFHQPEKKRRLSAEQVQFLEKSFELENKLEPDRKIQLAKDLGLQPRQVAIWFQNRRARWKTKQLEKDYDVLQAGYNSLKNDYDSLLKEKDKLKAEVLDLTEKLKFRQSDKGDSELSDANKLSQEPTQKPTSDPVSESEASKNSTVMCKQEEISPAKSDTFDSESPRYPQGVHSSLLDPGDSSYAFEPDQSDVSQDDDDALNKNLMPTYIFPKIEEAADYSAPPTNSCNFGFPVEDQPFWSWSY